MASEKSLTKSEDDDDEVWKHRPLKRVRKSLDHITSSQQNNATCISSRGTAQGTGIPRTQSRCSGYGAGAGVLTPSTKPSQLLSNHQSRRKIFDSSQKPNKQDCTSQPNKTSATTASKSGRMSHHSQQRLPETESETKSIKTEEKILDRNIQMKAEEYCPMCQAPYSCIHLSSPEEHIQDCLEFAKPDNECPKGLSCDITILSHYQKFSHNLLAVARSEMAHDISSVIDEDDCKTETFTQLKPEVMTSDSDFEKPSCSKPAALRTFRKHSTPQEEYDFKIEGDRVTCTPRKQCPSQVSASQSKLQSKLKNTARKSMKGAIKKNQRNSDRMMAVKEEMCTPKVENQRECKESLKEKQEKTGESSELKRGLYHSSQTPSSESKFTVESGSSSRKRPRKNSSPGGDIPTSRSLFDYFTPSQKAALAQKAAAAKSNAAPHSPHASLETNVTRDPSVSEESQPFVESDMDIFDVDENEYHGGDQNDVIKSKVLTTSDECEDKYVRLKPKHDSKRIPGPDQSLENDAGKATDEPFFDMLDRLEDASDEESKSPVSFQNSKFDESKATSRSRPKKSNPPDFVQVPPAPDQDDATDEELPQFDLTCGSLEELCEDNDGTSKSGGQRSTSGSQVNDAGSLGGETQDEESESLFNIPSEKNEDNEPTLNHDEGNLAHAAEFSEEEESQSLFNIPSEKNEDNGPTLNHGNLADTAEFSEKEESQSLLNIPSGKNKDNEPTLNPGNLAHTAEFSEKEEIQSLFNIPDETKEGHAFTSDTPADTFDDVAVCSENEEEEMEVDDVDEEPTYEERPSVSGWRGSDSTSVMSAKGEDCSRLSNINASTSSQAVAAKARKQGTLDSFLGCKPAAPPGNQKTLDSFLGCKPAPKLAPAAQTGQPKRQWRGSKQAYQKNNGDGMGQKEWVNNSGKQCPFYKKMPGTSFTVDAFQYGVIPGCKAYFLSHFHYDHYGGLTKFFDQQLYCSKVTGNLVTSRLKVAAEYVITLPMHEPCVVDGVEVTLLDANHCPGSVMFLFKRRSGAVYLHTGDFRADTKMEQYSELTRCHVSQLYLDTTYCDPQYKFPSQRDVIEFAVQTAVNAIKWNKRTLIVCGTYTIGKERVFRAIAEALQCKVYVESQKLKVLECLEDEDLLSLLTRDNQESRLHVIGMNMFSHQKLKEYLSKFSQKYDKILAFKPTGWTHSEKVESPSQIKPSKSGASTIYGIPYSEHSSYSEMKRFVQFLRPGKILPTVNNGNPKLRKAMEDIFKRWMTEDGRSSSPTRLQSGKIKNWFGK